MLSISEPSPEYTARRGSLRFLLVSKNELLGAQHMLVSAYYEQQIKSVMVW